MVQFSILSGRQTGSVKEIHCFPCVIGRSASADLRLEESGVWDQHLVLTLDSSHRFILKAFPNALAAANGKGFHEITLRNGDLIEIGSVKLQFWLNETRQKSLRMRELVTWLAFGFLCAGQIGLIYRLLR
jgi:pSer/pThr/pTyr-binding forkhead associated (FHA) protein